MRTLPALLLVNLAAVALVGQQQGTATADPLQAARQAVAAAEAEHGADGVAAAKARLALAKVLFGQGQAAAAEQAARACVTTFEAHLPAEEAGLSEALLVVGAIAGRRMDFVVAESCYRQALQLREHCDVADAPYVQLLRFNLAATLVQVFDFQGGLLMAEVGLQAAERAKGPESLAVGNFASVAALCFDGLGRLREANDAYTRAERIFRRIRGDDFPDALRMAGLAGATACRLGRPEEGLPKMAATLLAMRKVPQLDPEILWELLVADAALRVVYVGDAAAHDDVRRLIAELTAGSFSYSRDMKLLQLMSVLSETDPSVIDIEVAKRALLKCEADYGLDHVYVAGMLTNLVRVMVATGREAEVEPYLRRAVAIVDASPWFVSPDRWKMQWAMANLLRRAGDVAGAVDRIQRSLDELPRLLDVWSSPLDERQRLELTASTRASVDFLLSVSEQSQLPAVDRWRTVLAWKGLVSRGLLQSLEWLHQNLDPEAQQLAADLRAAVGRWSALTQSGAPAATIDAARIEREAIERRFEQHLETRPTTAPDPAAVTAGLAADEVLLDFFSFGHLQQTTTREVAIEERLLCFVARRGEAPVLVELGPLAAIADATEAFLRVASRWTRPVAGADALVAASGAKLADLVWTPLRDAIPAGSRIVVSPDSVIALVSFACLPGATAGSFLIEDHEFVYVATAADLVHPAARLAQGERCKLLAVGGVDYGAPSAPAEQREAVRTFAPLPGSGTEVDTIAALFAEGRDSAGVVLRGAAATADRFATAAAEATIVHVATHGWFRGSHALPDPARRWANFEAPGKSLPAGALHPGADSGLAFAGANLPATAGGDGVLTEDEVALLDLGHCDLAVLSACETALGTISAGDGLLGLRRALRLAGAKRSLTSVWRVDDAATQRLMQSFYTQLWQHGSAPAAALRAAQLTMLQQARDASGQAQIGSWGAFVLESR